MKLDPYPDAVGDGSDQSKCHPVQAATLNLGDGRLIDAARCLQIGLSPPLPEARGTNEATDSAIIHAPMIAPSSYQRLTDG